MSAVTGRFVNAFHRRSSLGVLALALAACSSPAPRVRATGARTRGPDTVAFSPPADSTEPDGPATRAAQRGRALLAHTRDSLPAHVGAALQCVSCHPNDGRQPDAMPWVGVYARYPQYRARSASVGLIEDRVNDCFIRSMNGTALDPAGPDMRDIVAYLAFLSRGVPVGAVVRGQGLRMLSVTHGDSARGGAIFDSSCARCHGPKGDGTAAAPPVWGPHSFNIGAGMARARTAAAFIRYNMPFDRPGTLTDQQAADVAAYITAQPRPDFPGKERDWPEGGAPADVAYPTLYQRQHPGAPRR